MERLFWACLAWVCICGFKQSWFSIRGGRELWIGNSRCSPTSISWHHAHLWSCTALVLTRHPMNHFSSVIYCVSELSLLTEGSGGHWSWCKERWCRGRSGVFPGDAEPLVWLGCVRNGSWLLNYEIVAQMVWLPVNDNSAVRLIKRLFQKHCWCWYKLAWLQSVCHLSGRLWNALAKLACVLRLCLDHIDPNENPSY